MTQLDLDAIGLILKSTELDIESKTNIIIEIVNSSTIPTIPIVPTYPIYPPYISSPEPGIPLPIVTYSNSK